MIRSILAILFLATSALGQIPNLMGPVPMVQTVDTIATLLARQPVTNILIGVRGNAVVGDWGDAVDVRWVRYDPTSAAATNNYCVFATTNNVGRWIFEDCLSAGVLVGRGSSSVGWAQPITLSPYIGINNTTLYTATNSASLSGILPPYASDSIWMNGAWLSLNAGTNMEISATSSNVTIAMTNNFQNLTNWFTFLAGTNMEVTVTGTSVSYAMTNDSFSGGSSLLVNGSTLTNANFIDGGLVKFVVSGTNVYAYITNYVAWENIELQGLNLKDGVYVAWSNSGTNLTPYIPAEALDPTRWEHLNWPTLMGRYSASIGDIEYISVGANLNLDPATGILSATVPAGTNSWQIAVAGTLVNEPNLIDTDRIDVVASGTNITFDIKDSSVGTNHFTATPLNLLLNQYRVNNLTNWFLSITNNNSADSGRVVWYTNSLGDYVAYATNLPAGGGSGAGTNAFVNGVLYQPFYITNSATVTWGTNANGHVQATSVGGGGGAGTNAFVNGVLVQPLYLTNSPSALWSTNGNGHVVITVNDYDGFWSDLTNALVAGSNVGLAYDTGLNKITISATVSGSTNGTPVSVDGGSVLTAANFTDASTTGLFDISGTNITIRLPDRDFGAITVGGSGTTMALDDGTVTSNKVVAANITIDKLSASGTPLSTNFLAGDYSWKQITTNMIPGLVADILSAATNGPAGGSGTSVFVNGSTVSNPNFTNSSTVLFSVANGTNVTATVTNVAGATTDNVVQRIGNALFYVSGDPAVLTNASYSGIVTNVTLIAGGSGVPLQVSLALSGANSTNYVVIAEGYEQGSALGFGYAVDNKTTTGVDFWAEYSGSAPDGTWMRVWLLDTATVGGSGGDVISTNNNNFTQTNNFAGPVNAATMTVNDVAYGAGWDGSTNVVTANAVYDKIESMSSGGGDVYTASNNVFTGNNTFSGSILFGNQSRTSWRPKRREFYERQEFLSRPALLTQYAFPWAVQAISSGTVADATAIETNHIGVVSASSASGANSGVYALTALSAFRLFQGLETEFVVNFQNTNSGSIGRYGWADNNGITAPTDALNLFRSNNFIFAHSYSNGVLSQASTSYNIESNVWYSLKISMRSDNIADFKISNESESILWSESITNGIPNTVARATGHGFITWYTNAAVSELHRIDFMDVGATADLPR